MYYYAILNDDDICTEIYSMPVQISGNQVIAISSNDQSLIGQHYNRTKREFEAVYYYAVLNEKGIVTETVYYDTQQQTSDTFRAITFAQYQTVKGLYWNGTDYVTPPISIAAVASTDEINYKDQDKWLSTTLDEIEANVDNAFADISTLSTNLSTVTTALQTVSENLAALNTTVEGKAEAVHGHTISAITGLDDALTALDGEITDLQTAVNGKAAALHTHTAADLSGVVKTVNGNEPDASGNIVVTSGGMTADEILTAVKTVDGAGSGLDADTLDGLHAASFATANHTHNEYATVSSVDTLDTTVAGISNSMANVETALGNKADSDHNHDTEYAAINHEHSGYATTAAVTSALADKSDTTHNHDTAYAPLAHTHTMENVTGLVTALAGKSNTDHNHNTAYAGISHGHAIDNITGLSTALSGKASSTHNHDTKYAAINHTHSGYAATEHTHTGYATTASVTALEKSLDGKANKSHTHAQSDITGLTTALSGKANTTHTHAQGDVTGLTAALNGKANTSHTHTISNVTGLQSALDGKANASHSHSDYFPTSGGTIDGDVNVNGIIRANGNQAYYHNAGTNTVTIGTNNALGVTVGCASSGTTAFNSGTVSTYNIIPRNASSYLGDTSNRWKTIYAQNTVNVTSDERLKKDINRIDTKQLADFIDKLEVIEFKYLNEDDSENKHIGVTAQKCLESCSQTSQYFVCCDENGYYSMRPAELVFPLIAAVQKLSKEVKKLKPKPPHKCEWEW